MQTKHSQQGISVPELLIAVVIGVGLLGAGIAFMINTTRTLKLSEDNARNTSVAQQVLSKMTKELKGVPINSPPLYAVNIAWSTLPALPYDSLETTPNHPNTAGTVGLPSVPAARKFLSQSGATDIAHKWYPNPTGNESNSLVFYRAPAPGPGGTSIIERVTYRLLDRKLYREVQSPMAAGANSFYSSPTPVTTVLTDDVQLIQFTYPIFEQQMSAALDTQLLALAAVDRSAFINENFRKVIGIRIVLGGGKIKNQELKGIELKTEVRLRSE